ncbi:MAG: serine hydrolase domain-containing protein [Acholeplasmataceae bacterium]|nr:serine hydrolase domain-containing protein [Acholeplasmataceae bacterium]
MYSEIKELLKRGVEENLFPGASYCIVHGNGEVFCDFVGYKSLIPEKIMNQGNEIYDVASLTKVISTTTMVMKLIENGRLSLDTRVSSILPEFKHKEITIYHLLTHTSGLPADISRASRLKGKDEVLNRVYEMELIYSTGKNIVYSDIGFILLGWIIESLTKMSLDTYSSLMIFRPLEMNDTSYHPNRERCAPTEFRADDVYHGMLQGIVHDEKSFALGGEAGHAGLFSTAKDISKFILAVLQNKFVLNTKYLDELFPLREEKPNLNNDILTRALGWDKPQKGSSAGDKLSLYDSIIHTGFTGCNMFIDKKNQLGFVLLSNAVHPRRDMNQIIKLRNKIGNMIFSEWEENKHV